VEWPPLGLGVRALAALSGRGLSGWAGRLAGSARGVPAAKARLARPRRTPNPGCDGWGRSARLIPSPRRRGSRRYGIPRASAHRRCNPALLDERKLRLSAAGAPARHQGSLSQQMAKRFLSRFSSTTMPGSSSKPCDAHPTRPRLPGCPGVRDRRETESRWAGTSAQWTALRGTSWRARDAETQGRFRAACASCRGAFRVRPAGYPQQLGRIAFQHSGDVGDNLQPRIGRARF
jgi:hypothetical protein